MPSYQHLHDYRRSTTDVEAVFEKLTEHDLSLQESPTEWTIQQIVHHICDVEVGDALRLRQMLSHDSPQVLPYDEQLFAAHLHYERPIASSIAIFSTLRAAHIEILERIDAAAWSRAGHHPEHDAYSVEILVVRSIEHDIAHSGQIARARERRRLDGDQTTRSRMWTTLLEKMALERSKLIAAAEGLSGRRR